MTNIITTTVIRIIISRASPLASCPTKAQQLCKEGTYSERLVAVSTTPLLMGAMRLR